MFRTIFLTFLWHIEPQTLLLCSCPHQIGSNHHHLNHLFWYHSYFLTKRDAVAGVQKFMTLATWIARSFWKSFINQRCVIRCLDIDLCLGTTSNWWVVHFSPNFQISTKNWKIKNTKKRSRKTHEYSIIELIFLNMRHHFPWF